MLILSFIEEWLLFIFPLYQSWLELEEQESTIRALTKDDRQYPKISSWYWVLPFYKIAYEKRRSIEIIQKEGLSSGELKDILRYFDKSTDWFYVSLAGLLNSISTTYEVFEHFNLGHHLIAYWLTVLFLIVFGFINSSYRMGQRRKKTMFAKVLSKKQINFFWFSIREDHFVLSQIC